MIEETNNIQNKIELSMPVQYIKGVGPARAKVFSQLGVETLGDLLEYFPRDWNFLPDPIKINQMQPKKEAAIIAMVESIDYQSFRRQPLFEALVSDETGICRIVWFHGSYLRNQIEPGQIIFAYGKVNLYKHQIQLANPKFLILDEENSKSPEDLSGGIYPATKDLSNRQIKRIIKPVLETIDELVEEFFDKSFLKHNILISRNDAFKWIHQPPDDKKLSKAKRRLKHDELFLMQLGLALRRYKMQHFSSATACNYSDEIDSRIRKRFPFLLTEDQNNSISEIIEDMGKQIPMNRLLQGDVGSGKTVVALYAALLAIANKMQVAIMAPTEILAGQHFLSIERYLKNSQVKRTLITGGLSGKKRSELLETVKNGDIDIVIGTVALLQNDIEFQNLGLVVIDEQHKFGVEQRAELRKQTSPHCLVMTATPIPRTLAMTAFGDLDVSIISHCPPGRGKIITRRVEPENRQKAYEFIRERLRAKKQAYFVYPRITSIEQNGDIKAATDEWVNLSKNVFPEFKVELLHGQMKSEKKQEIMSEFRKGKIDALVSTVVIEVGVDVPNATIMVIEGADRFGLAQLHQLRGRIGRGEAKSYCFLFSESDNEIANSRLDVMTRTNDGFEIAESDLRLRGPGEMFSTRQHGLPDLKIANIIDDYELLVMARKNAFELVNKDPMLIKSEHKNIRKELLHKFGDTLGLADIA
ncbi:MAG: ATP-dependent DNA helicase RecG [Sedimentisphaerales bacterium]|nr:ATP-dependent DNA helicase RecG [Sedimentisphaerales bacterium]